MRNRVKEKEHRLLYINKRATVNHTIQSDPMEIGNFDSNKSVKKDVSAYTKAIAGIKKFKKDFRMQLLCDSK